MNNESLTKEEEILLKKLAPAPKCMHDPEFTIDLGRYRECGKCGLIASKGVEIAPGVYINGF